jgi:hypothetical protein
MSKGFHLEKSIPEKKVATLANRKDSQTPGPE